MEYAYDFSKLKYVISRHLRGERFENGDKLDFVLGIDCYDFWMESLLKLQEEIDVRVCHVFFDHKKAACKAIEYLMQDGKIHKGEQLLEGFHYLMNLAVMARNMAIKYNITKDRNIIDRMVSIYREMKGADIEYFEKFYESILLDNKHWEHS